MLHLLFGPAGSGKTGAVTQSIRRDIERGIPCFLLVPEQQAYISERDIPQKLPREAGLLFEVLTFSRLAEKVFRAFGGAAHPSVEIGVRNLLMWDVLRQLAPTLLRYRVGGERDTSLVPMMMKLATELRTSGVTEEQLDKIAEQLPEASPLRAKLLDLSAIVAAYHTRLEETCGADPADLLGKLCERLDAHDLFSGTHIYIDSFTDFTSQEYAVLRQICRQAAEVTVTLCADAPIAARPQFATVCKTGARLNRLSSDLFGQPAAVEILPQSETKRPPVLRFLEKNLWNFRLPDTASRPAVEEAAATVTPVLCANLYEESEAAAMEILRLVQSGARYRDIAVIVRDTEVYRGVLDAVLERHGIPCFLSERTDLSSKPLSRLILSALCAVSRNYRASDVISILKTGLCAVEPKEVALFEEYCETWHIGGSRFTDAVWNMNPDGLTERRSERGEEILAAANRVRETVMKPLIELSAALRLSDKLPDRLRAIYGYLRALNISERLSARAERELGSGDRRRAGETVRLYRLITGTLTSLCRLLPDIRLTVEELITILSMLFDSSDLGSIPTADDCVVIGSASTLRVENIRSALILGLCEGDFPRTVTDDGLLTEGDRVALEEFDIRFDSDAARRSADELFYFYRAVAKPTRTLWLSAVKKDTDGTDRTPSIAFTHTLSLLGLAPHEFYADEIGGSVGCSDLPAAEEERRVAQNGAPTVLHLSQSSIASFIRCPYSYFAVKRLQLREPKDATPAYNDDGEFMHTVMEQFLRRSLSPDGKLILPPDGEIEPIVDGIVDAYLKKIFPFPPEEIGRHILHVLHRLKESTLLMLLDTVAELKRDRYVPSAFEEAIGDGDALPAVAFRLKDGSEVRLSGRIDRVDLCEEGGDTWIRVVDYKMREHKFSPKDVQSGKDIQLILYLFAATSGNPRRKPACAEFVYPNADANGENPYLTRSGILADDAPVAEDEASARYRKDLKSGNAAEIQTLCDEMRAAVCDVAERILAGEASKTPSEDACRFCPVRSRCNVAVTGRR